MKIKYRDDPCGVGKTRAELIRMASQPGKYVLALDRREAIRGRVDELIAHAADAGSAPVIQVLCSRGDGLHLIGVPTSVEIASAARRGGVMATIAALPVEASGIEHIIVIVTHEGLGMSDLSGFAGWHLIVDEAPSAWECATERSPALLRHLEASYSLQPLEGTDWSRVLVRDDSLSLGDIRSDETLFRWGSFHRRVQSRRGVLASVTNWATACSGRRWSWFSLWAPDELAAFDDVVICAHAFQQSVAARLWASVWPEIEWQQVATPSKRTLVPRRVLIRYVATHLAGTCFWSSADGRRCLEAWMAWIAGMYPKGGATPHLVTCNKANGGLLAAAGIGGDHPTVRVAGSNAYAHIHDVSIAYAAKPSPHEAKVLAGLGVSSEEVVQGREHEDLIQFVTRSSVRDPHSAADVRINLYDHEQAEITAAYLRRHYPFDVVVERVEIGIGEVRKPRVGRPPMAMTEPERAGAVAKRKLTKTALQKKRRAAAKAAKVMNSEARQP